MSENRWRDPTGEFIAAPSGPLPGFKAEEKGGKDRDGNRKGEWRKGNRRERYT